MDILIVIIAALSSGLLSVLISNKNYKKSEARRLKINVLKQLYGNRHEAEGDKFTEALHQIFVVFYDSKDIIMAYKALYEARATNASRNISGSRMIDLFKAMFKYLKMESTFLNDEYFLKVFNIKQNIQK